jgi:hypothetical protein
MDVPGRWAGGFRARDEHGVYLATGRGATGGRVLKVPADVLRERLNAWFPFGRHLIEGLCHRTLHRVDGTTARVPDHPRHARRRPRARDQQPCSCRHPSGRRARDRVPDAALLPWPARPGRDLGPAVHRLDALRRQIEPQAAAQDPLALADREEVLALWLSSHGIADEWMIAPPLAAAVPGWWAGRCTT